MSVLASVQLLGAVVAIWLGVYAYRRRERPGMIWLVAVLFGDTVWMVAAGVNYASHSLVVSTAMLQIRYVGITVIPIALLFFALSYTGYDEWLTPWHRGLIALPALGALLLALTDSFHGLFYASVTPASNPQHVAYEYGLVAAPWIAYAFVIVVVATAAFVRYAIVAEDVYRWQTCTLAGAVSTSVVADALFFLPVPPNGFAITPLAILVSSAIAVAIISRFDFGRLVPATRELGRKELIEQMELGMVVRNADGLVVDVNPAAARILGYDTDELLGEQAPEALPNSDDPDVVQRLFTVDGVDRNVEVRTIQVGKTSGTTVITFHQMEDFTEIVSHDLQGPLMEIRGSADLAMSSGDITHIEHVLDAANRIDELVSDVLELSRIGPQLETHESVDLADCADTAWRHVWTPTGELVVETDQTVMGDPSRIQQLFENLFRNSVEHSSSAVGQPADTRSRGRDGQRFSAPSEGADERVRVTVGPLPEGFYVEDTGPGIAPEDQERIFEKGYTNSPTGTGLGLSIVRQIAVAHGWSIRVTEGREGGARFEISDAEFGGEPNPDDTPG
ncbi:PAS domain-containing protein [Salinadaptatus halalkaliphilus]|uniref:histidine kinase n=1 Tax=Salinadaptatus halalkaliphilus TaxID=2419781 RepID=A0A4S3TQN3_9EURY|nr:histidine kinase N-terminal 7TM domain-containing protein [Salinadaptatus halalkaliphilus]THE66701.1 PAS domain-containing protein [Salinadaptatus halalkaliphilus]